jgi:peroxiredoxin
MINALHRLAVLAICFGFATAAHALRPGDRVDNFMLLDQHGVSHELYYLSDAKAVVLMVHGCGCPIVRNALPGLKEVRDRYRAQGVEFLLINSNLQDDRDAVAKEATEFGIDFPILVDRTQLIGESLGVTRTADVFVIDPRSWTVVYRGPIDDRLAYGKQKPAATHAYLSAALDALLAGDVVAVAQAETAGCLVHLPEQEQRAQHAQISYAEQVAPLLLQRCAGCHREGGVGDLAISIFFTVV